LKIFIFFFIFFFNTSIYAINIATVDLDLILNKSFSYQVFINTINEFIYMETLKFKDNETILQKNKADIESKQNILNESEFNKLILNYNEQLNIYQTNINNFNVLIDENIEVNKKIIINKVIEIVKEISIKDNYDLILTSNNFLLAHNKFDISNQVIIRLDEYKILLKTNNIK